VYSKSTRVAGVSGTGSDSRSRTSGSLSNADLTHYNHHYLNQHHHHHAPPRSATAAPHSQPAPKPKKRSKSSKHSSSTSRSDSISTPPPHQTSFPAIAEQYDDGAPARRPHAAPLSPSSPRLEHPAGFPSVGFGGGRMSRKNSEAGVLLATRGE
jgi:hypothetical protein